MALRLHCMLLPQLQVGCCVCAGLLGCRFACWRLFDLMYVCVLQLPQLRWVEGVNGQGKRRRGMLTFVLPCAAQEAGTIPALMAIEMPMVRWV